MFTWRRSNSFLRNYRNNATKINIVLLVAALSVSGTYCYNLSEQSPPGYSDDDQITLSVAKKGVKVIGTTIAPFSTAPVTYSIKCVSPDGAQMLNTLMDLKGLVEIKNASDALTFVRLRTSLGTFAYWPGGWTLEVFRSSEKATDFFPSGPGNPADAIFGNESDKGTGVLTDAEFATMGFALPTVVQSGNEYVVTRWLLGCSPNNNYKEYFEKVQETIGSDGDYTLTVLKKADVPIPLMDGPHGVEWEFGEPPPGAYVDIS